MTENMYRAVPGIFVRRLSIYRAYPVELLHTISFETGLNIVAGDHNSGKTTLFRFLRYILGDKDYADKDIRTAIKAKLADGGLLGEIVVNGIPWAVWRPFEQKMDWVDSAAIISDADAPLILASNAYGFDKYIAALEDLADDFSNHPSFAGAPHLSWSDLLNLYTRDDDSYSKTIYAWIRHAFGTQDALPKSKKECWPFLLKLLGMSVVERDIALARLSELEIDKQLIEKAEEESQAKHQKDKDYSARLLQDAKKEFSKIFATEEQNNLFDFQRRSKNFLKTLQDNHTTAIDDIQRKAISLSEARVKRESLEKEQAELNNRKQFLTDAAKADERRLQNAREALERIKYRIDSGEVCEDGRIFVSACKTALDAAQKAPEELVKDSYWMERNEAKDEDEKTRIRARLQDLLGEIVVARENENRAKGILADAEEEERKIRANIGELAAAMNLHARAIRIEESIQEQTAAEAEHINRVDKLMEICTEIENKNIIVQDQDAILAEGLKNINTELNHATKQFLGANASARLELFRDNLELMVRDGNGGGGNTYDTVVRPLILDWLMVYFGVTGKSPHHAFFIQDSPFKSEMKVSLQEAYLKMLLSLSTGFLGSFQQIILTSSSGADNIKTGSVNVISLTPELSGRLLPGIELSRHGFEQIKNVDENSNQ